MRVFGSMSPRLLDDQDYSWLSKAFESALSGVRRISAKESQSSDAVDGEVFTHIRSMGVEDLKKDSPLRRLFNNRRERLLRLDGLRQEDKEKVSLMYRQLKERYLQEKDEMTRLRELEAMVACLRAGADRMREIATSSEAVRDGIDALDEILGV